MLPTPTASDAHRGKRGGKTGRNLGTVVAEGLGDGHEAAIAHWARRTRPAPPASEPNRVGGRRVAVAFAEWMMGWPDGWVTDPPLSRPDSMTIIGNGVVPQQALAALRSLLNTGEVGRL